MAETSKKRKKKKVPKPHRGHRPPQGSVRLALQLYEALMQEPEKLAHLEHPEKLRGFLPALAQKLDRCGYSVDESLLLRQIASGWDHMQQLDKTLRGDILWNRSRLDYDAIVRAFGGEKDESVNTPPPAPEFPDPTHVTAEVFAENDYRLFREAIAHAPVPPPQDYNSEAVQPEEWMPYARSAYILSLLDRFPEHAVKAMRSFEYEGFRSACENGHGTLVFELLDRFPALAEEAMRAGNYDAFRQAALNGHESLALELLDRFPAQEAEAAIWAWGYEAFRTAAKKGHESLVLGLLDRLPALAEQALQANNYKAFYEICEKGHESLALKLLDRFPDLAKGAMRAEDYGAFRLAASRGHESLALKLLDHLPVREAEEAMRSWDYDAFYGAASGGHESLAFGLLDRFPALAEEAMRAGNYRAFCWAALNGHDSLALGLLDHFPAMVEKAIRAQDYGAFRWAVRKGHESLALGLLDRFPALAEEAMRAGNYGALNYGAFCWAAEYGHETLATGLLSRWMQVRDWPATPEGQVAALREMRQDIPDEQAFCGAVSQGFSPVFALWLNDSPDNPLTEIDPQETGSLYHLLQQEGYKGKDAVDYAARLARLFESEQDALRYLKQHGQPGKTPLHDLAVDIVFPKDTEAQFDLAAWRSAIMTHGPKMARLLKFADNVPAPIRSKDGKGWLYHETRAEVAKHIFTHAAQHPELADFCFSHDLDEDDFDAARKHLAKLAKKGLEGGKKDAIPEIEISGADFGKEGYVLKKLPRGDYRGLFLGEITDCCQSLGNVGEDCAEHGFHSARGGFYVITKAETDEIVAQSWVWRGQKGELVLDSLEALRGQMSDSQWQQATQALAKELAKPAHQKQHITRLLVGKGGRTPDTIGQACSDPAKPIDYDSYRDSKTQTEIARFKLEHKPEIKTSKP